MASTLPLRFKGAPGSPYTRKMLAYLRYRHIPYELLIGDQDRDLGLPKAKVHLLPTFYLPNADGDIEAVVDSTPLIRRFEKEFSGKASLPPNPVLDFLNYLIEDYGDEWLTKPMFHYRWRYQADIDMAATILPRWTHIQATQAQLEAQSAHIAERQISRLHVVGSNEVTAPVIEASYRRFLEILDALIQRQGFVLGSRPASADFALYAQLTQLVKFDPTPAALCLKDAPRVYAWTDLMDDLSGLRTDETGWMSTDDVKTSLDELLSEIGRTYAPALLANARAIQAGEAEMRTSIDGLPWEQPAFPYQAKCLRWITEAYQRLGDEARTQVDQILTGTGCERLFV